MHRRIPLSKQIHAATEFFAIHANSLSMLTRTALTKGLITDPLLWGAGPARVAVGLVIQSLLSGLITQPPLADSGLITDHIIRRLSRCSLASSRNHPLQTAQT